MPPLAGDSLGRRLEDLREEPGGPRGGLEVRWFHVVVADESSWIGVADDRHVERENLNEVAVSNVARHRRVRRDDIGIRGTGTAPCERVSTLLY